MIIRKRILISMIVAAICLFSSSVPAAENWQWCVCDVLKMGVGGGRYEFQLAGTYKYGPGAVNAWFEVHPSSAQLQKEILAIAMTAVTLGKKVEVLLIPGVTASLYAIYLIP